MIAGHTESVEKHDAKGQIIRRIIGAELLADHTRGALDGRIGRRYFALKKGQADKRAYAYRVAGVAISPAPVGTGMVLEIRDAALDCLFDIFVGCGVAPCHEDGK
jgi:hypothetical protein